MKESTVLHTQVHKLYTSAREEVQKLKFELKEATEAESFYGKYLNFIEKNWVLHILDLLEKESSRLKRLREIEHPAISSIEDSYRLSKEEAKSLFRRYPSLLENACKEAKLSLDPSSRHPKYNLENGFFRLEIDESKRTAKLFNYEGQLSELPADIEAVIEMIRKEYDRIFGRKFDEKKFLKQLRSQYKAIVKKDGLSDSESVPIRHITRRMSKNIKGFRTDEFLIDLSRLAEKGPYEIDGRKLDLQQTKDTNQGMLLYGAEKRGYIGFIIFREV